MKHPKHYKAMRYVVYAACLPLWLVSAISQCFRKSCQEMKWQWRYFAHEISLLEQEHARGQAPDPVGAKELFLAHKAAEHSKFKGLKP